MRKAPLAFAAALAGATALAVAGVAGAAGHAAGSAPASKPAPASVRSCAQAADGFASCFSLRRTDIPARRVPVITPAGYGPADLQAAYALPSATGGSGQTVGIVDAFDAPSAESDLATYRAQFGLPPCTTANGCFRKVNQDGNPAPLPAPNAGWAEEIALDVDMVSAICPNCHILLVEATTNSIANLGAAVNTAVLLGAKYVSNSYGGSESHSETSWDTSWYRHDGVAVTASSGDSGFGTSYPAASRYVTSVGGTSLTPNGTGWSETAWSGAGSGCSRYEGKPTWQTDAGCSKRTIADVSAVADPNTGVAVFSTEAGGWAVFGGTSVSSPIIASVYALAGTPGAADTPASYPYAHPGNLRDVTSGSNGSCRKAPYLCTAGPGYDGPTGLGTPQGTGAFVA
jgi:subtilase family serine protease